MKIWMILISALIFLLFSNNEIFAQDQDKNWIAPKYANDIKNPYKGDEKATAHGKKLFNSMCYICHGKTGEGNGFAGVSITPRPADFLSTYIKNETDGAIFWKMTEGKPPMASYKDLLTEEQRWELVCYIRKLQESN